MKNFISYKKIQKIIQTSRPRFWIYVLWPILLTISAYLWASSQFLPQDIIVTCVFLLFVSIPANLFIYWVNDIADTDTDVFNEKKTWYEQSFNPTHDASLLRILLIFQIPYILFFVYIFSDDILWLMSILLFYFTAFYYSYPPIRAKAHPFIDWIFNILYILPAIWLYIYYFSTLPNLYLVLAWWLRCMAMHAYSAIPDIKPDKKAWLCTTSVFLWKEKSARYCALLYMVSWVLWGLFFHRICFVLGFIYAIYVVVSVYSHRVFENYKLFPIINTAVWFILFRLILFEKII